jgi:prepilin-type N-terminal cleavage/methylation domain-containing protein
MLANRRGFTLIELLIVTVIIGLLAMVALPRFGKGKEKAYDASALADLHQLMQLSEAYFADNMEYPTDIDQVEYHQSKGIEVCRFRRETTDDVIVVHIHIRHTASPHYYHVEYPVEQIEERNGSC